MPATGTRFAESAPSLLQLASEQGGHERGASLTPLPRRSLSGVASTYATEARTSNSNSTTEVEASPTLTQKGYAKDGEVVVVGVVERLTR
ncbi:unnamed protein product [Cutaneotrichosporon oleaginosum]